MDAETMERLLRYRVSTDTRLIEKNDLFFAFPGEKFDGHDFIAQAVEKGARHVVVSDAKRVTAALAKKANFIGVSDTVRAYGDLAAYWRRRSVQESSCPAMAGLCGPGGWLHPTGASA